MSTSEFPKSVAAPSAQGRLRRWLLHLHRDPDAEERAMEERRRQLLEDLSRAVAESLDDVPIKNIIARLNRHDDD